MTAALKMANDTPAFAFEKYRIPASVREGVELELPDAPGAKFLVRLPSSYNREYTMAQQRALKVRLRGDGTPDLDGVDFLAWNDARHQAFVDHCIIAYPEGLSPELLLGEYRPALRALFDLASERAEAEEAEAEATVKK